MIVEEVINAVVVAVGRSKWFIGFVQDELDGSAGARTLMEH